MTTKIKYNQIEGALVSVKDYGALGDAATDDTAAINAAIAYAQSLSTVSQGPYTIGVLFPAGHYRCYGGIDATDAIGLLLKGESGKYLGTHIMGWNGGVAIDFTGSNNSGAENITVYTDSSWNGQGLGASKIGFQFARTGTGGLDCFLRNCQTLMGDDPTANSGWGNIGCLNLCAENFSAHNCAFTANAPFVGSKNTPIIAIDGSSHAVVSAYSAGVVGGGSMGVIFLDGETDLYSVDGHMPALSLYQANDFSFEGYIGTAGSAANTTQAAIYMRGCATMKVMANIETFSKLLTVHDALDAASFKLISSTGGVQATPVIDISGVLWVQDVDFRCYFPNQTEAPNATNSRIFLYSALVNGGDDPYAGVVRNSLFKCTEVIASGNPSMVSRNVFKQCKNVRFETLYPFEISGGQIRPLWDLSEGAAGTVGAPGTAIIYQWRLVDRATTGSGNAAKYSISVEGCIRGGNYASGYITIARFRGTVSAGQVADSTHTGVASTVTMLELVDSNVGVMTVTGVALNIVWSGNFGQVTLTPTAAGTGTTEVLTYNVEVKMLPAGHYVNEAIPYI